MLTPYQLSDALPRAKGPECRGLRGLCAPVAHELERVAIERAEVASRLLARQAIRAPRWSLPPGTAALPRYAAVDQGFSRSAVISFVTRFAPGAFQKAQGSRVC